MPPHNAQFSRQTIIAAADILKSLGHSGLDRLLLEFGLSDPDAGKGGGGLLARATSLAQFAIHHPEEQTAEGLRIGEAIVRRAAQEHKRYPPGNISNVRAEERQRFENTVALDGFAIVESGDLKPSAAGEEEKPADLPSQPPKAAAKAVSVDDVFDQDAESAVIEAIEELVSSGKRAYSLNVPLTAEQILIHKGRGRISTAESNSRIKSAISAMMKNGILQAFAEPRQDWILRLPKSDTERAPRVFIVHGHDDASREAVARFLEKLGFEAVILHEQANRGRTIITKFREVASDIGFAVVLMTADDQGGKAGAPSHPRARQNVVFELGFFIGALGPDRVAALLKGDVEKPSDFDGVLYISLDKGDWKTLLARELRAAGYQIDLNKAL